MHIGNDATWATTSWPPWGSSAITRWAPQSENQTRPSCQRGDSPNTTPSINTLMQERLPARSRLIGRGDGSTTGRSANRLRTRLRSR